MTGLLERDSFLHELDLMLKEALAGQGHVALVSGEAGIGKSSLVEYFTQTHQDSVRVLWGTCDSLFTPRPLGPLHDIAMQLKGELSVFLHSNTDRQAIFSACLTELQSQPTILVFEDVHWADEATLDLTKFLGRRIQRTPSLFILTYRDDELSAEHPLRFVLGDLPRGPTKRLHLLPLSESSVFALASAENQTERANELFDATGGNPFFVTEALASKGRSVPSTVRDVVLARAARLSPSARTALEAAAVIGVRAESWLLTKIVTGEAANVEECIAGGMLQFQGNDYSFRHELARQAILEIIPPERKLTLHRMILAVLKESPETRNDLARLANHAEGTRDVSAVLEYAPAAARQASAASSHREAIALYELALQFADRLPPTGQARMLEAYINELLFANRFADAVVFLQKVVELWHSIEDRAMEGEKLAWLTHVYYMIGRKAEAEQASQSAMMILESLPESAELAWVYSGRCFIRMEDRDCAEAVIWGEKAIALAERFKATETLARAYNYAGCAMLVIDYERGRTMMERSLAIGREANLPFTVAGTLANFSQILAELYQFADAERYLKEGIAYSYEHDDDYHLQGMLTLRALVRLYQGRWVEANQAILDAQQWPNRDLVIYTYLLFTIGRLRVRQGESTALNMLEEALALSLQAETIVRLGPVRAARAEMAWLAGDHDRAIEEARAVYDIAVGKEHPWIAGELAFWRWRAGDTFTAPAWIAKPFALQIAGDWRGAAEAWEGRGCPYEQALALLDGDEAAQLAALEIFERLGAKPAIEKLKQKMRAQGVRGVPRGPRPATRENPFGLTAREMEVLACLVQGVKNNAIAKKLSLSTRTVEHHIASILQKMQVESRNEAVALALKDNLLVSK
jgi:DNA-binding CsgD family transcriptional regulator/tetratricopeptide (TPR) repeat protein